MNAIFFNNKKIEIIFNASCVLTTLYLSLALLFRLVNYAQLVQFWCLQIITGQGSFTFYAISRVRDFWPNRRRCQIKETMATMKHPFLDGLKELPAGRQKELHKIRNWLHTQPHLPSITDEFVYLFLHSSYYNLDKTKSCIESYFTLKNNHPALFSNRDVFSPKIQRCMEIAHIVRLPGITPEGYRVLLFSVKDPDYTKLVFPDIIKGFCMFNDCVLSEDGLCDGYIVLFDMKGVSLGHIARVSLPALKAFMAYIQDAHPARLKAIHVLNTANYINHILRIIQPMIRSELIGLIKFHKGNVPDGFPIELMPKDYGGDAPSTRDLDEVSASMVSKYSEWLLDSEKIKVDESKRIRKASWWGLLSGTNPTPPDLETQKKQLFQNLQID